MISGTLLALVSGILIGFDRVITAGLATKLGPVRAAAWNAALTALFFFLLLWATGQIPFSPPLIAPTLWMAGAALLGFLVVTNSVLHELGAMRTLLLVLAGEALVHCLFDASAGLKSFPAAAAGILLVLLGSRFAHD